MGLAGRTMTVHLPTFFVCLLAVFLAGRAAPRAPSEADIAAAEKTVEKAREDFAAAQRGIVDHSLREAERLVKPANGEPYYRFASASAKRQGIETRAVELNKAEQKLAKLQKRRPKPKKPKPPAGDAPPALSPE